MEIIIRPGALGAGNESVKARGALKLLKVTEGKFNLLNG
jgi:hypothetical protein